MGDLSKKDAALFGGIEMRLRLAHDSGISGLRGHTRQGYRRYSGVWGLGFWDPRFKGEAGALQLSGIRLCFGDLGFRNVCRVVWASECSIVGEL